MGRRADPAAVKAAKAPVRSTRAKVAGAVEEAHESAGAAPAWLKGDGREIWQKLAPMMRGMRLLQAADEPAFARYCYNFARWRTLRSKLDKVGYTYLATTTNGGKLRRADPNFLIADRLERQLLAVEDRFGMSPSERQKIMAARANRPGELPLEPGRADDPAAEPAAPAPDGDEPIGMLN